MQTKHIVFGIVALSFVFLGMAYGMNTELGQEQGFEQTLGQVTFNLIWVACAYYGIVHVYNYFKKKLKPKISKTSI